MRCLLHVLRGCVGVAPAAVHVTAFYSAGGRTDRGDLADLAADLALPETALDAIQRYPLPEQLADGARYSSLCYFTPTSQPPQCGTLRHIQPPESADAPQAG